MQKPPTWELTEAVHTTAVAPIHIPVASGTSTTIPNSGMFGPHNFGPQNLVVANFKTIEATKAALAQEYQNRAQQLPQTLENELAATRLEGTTHPLPPADSLVRELGVRTTLLQRKNAEFQQKTALANRFYGSDPLDKKLIHFYQKAVTLQNPVMPGGIAIQAWTASYRAAHDARLLTQSIQVLNQQQINVQNWLATVQANDRAQAAAAQAQRLAAERARIAAEQQRQRELAEAAHLERARLTAIAEAQRLAEDRARIAAETRRLAAEKARVSEERRQQSLAEADKRKKEKKQAPTAEQARLEELARKQRWADDLARYSEMVAKILAKIRAESAAEAVVSDAGAKAETTAREPAAEQARPLKEMDGPLKALQQHELPAPEAQRVYPASGASASNSPALSFASRATHLPSALSSAVLTALRTAVQTVSASGAALFGSPVLVGFAALLMPSPLGNGERFVMSVPLAELSSEPVETLREIADWQGTLDLPVGLGTRRLGTGAEVFVATSDDFHIRSSVLVLNAAYDLLNDVYQVALPDSPTDFLTWTPAVSPGNSSTQLPITETDTPAYSGAPMVPIEGRLDLNPILVEGWERFIIVFPDQSGIAPLYVVFSSPYEGATTKGKYSGRDFNPEQAGGPILSLDWRTAVITESGIDAVKLHIARLDQSDANDIMIQRLEKILSGHLMLTDTDLRYYTHEVRELERFRAIGLSDEFKPESGSPTWNNAHTATLEDFRLGSDDDALYSSEAIQAANNQIDRIYDQLLKGKNQ
ncbi:S-type pyocin domain-containing protein [Pseudomonas granadensis]|uniref:S-type pyocin domain-containing protein n=1 Tax=Pseudomonas granadensis TaxID=1421430 RepID=UPI001F151AFA|nr:S-type pyocin domain-containing protein [Pseudomonas granadensis]